MYVCYEKPEPVARYLLQCLRVAAGTVSGCHEAPRVLLLIRAGFSNTRGETRFFCCLLIVLLGMRGTRLSLPGRTRFFVPTTGFVLPASQCLRSMGQQQCLFCAMACCSIDRASDLRLPSNIVTSAGSEFVLSICGPVSFAFTFPR